MKKLSHIDARGEASMVDVSVKPISQREAVASGEIRLQKSTVSLIQKNKIAKGNVLATARIAGILAAKKTGELIPLCHPLPITHCEVNFEIPKSADRIVITASAKITAQTGIEMEALMAVSVAALTIYDMCKAVDKTMRITEVKLSSKTKFAVSEKVRK
ncbi:MAG: cyclic pyranopterin monophosphate synthase MoaC [Verrucomicrobiota bacterium]